MAWQGTNNENAGGMEIPITLTTALEVVINQGAEYMWVEVSNLNAADDKVLDQFEIAVKPHPDAAYHVFASTAAHYTVAIPDPILTCNEDMTILPSDTAGVINLRVKGMYSLRIQAAAAGGAGSDTHLTITWQVR